MAQAKPHVHVYESRHKIRITPFVTHKIHHVYRFHLKRFRAVLGKHRHHRVQYNLRLVQIRRRALDEHVFRLQRDRAHRPVNQRRQRQHRSVLIFQHRRDRARLDQRHVRFQFLVVLFIVFQQLIRSKRFRLLQRHELNLLFRFRVVRKRPFNLGQIVRPDGD